MKRIGVFFILFLTSCGGGGGGSGGDSTPAPTPAPVINLSASLSEQLVNSNITLTWSSSNTTSCTASGDWSGAKTTSGSEDVTISKAGTNTFSLACSGGGGTRSNAVTVIGFRNTDGIVVDGYISGADVFIDENDNFENDGSEYSTTSDNEGKFTIRYANGNLVSIGGTDLDSQTLLDNLLITHKLSGHTEFKAVTPITSIEAFMEVGANINDALGIDSSIDISITDPVANKGDDGIYDFLYEKGNQLTVLAYALQNIINDLNTTTETTEDYFKAIAEEIENEFNETSLKVDIETQTFINKTFENIIAAKAITIDETAKANTVIALSGVLPIVEVKASDDLTTSVIRFAISTLQEDIKAVANGTASAEKITSYTTNVIDYIAQDQNINSNDITPDITAIEDSITTAEDTPVTIDVLANDSYVTAAPISISVNNADNGTVEILRSSSDQVTYSPNLDYNGTDVFSYTITQGDKVSSADVTVTVTPVNDAPSIDVASTIQAAENQTAVTTISVSDVDEDELTLTMAGTDAESFILSNEYVLSFKEAPDYETKNSYSIELNLTDGNESVSKVISIIVNNSNDIAPVFISEPNFDAPENQIAIGTVNAIDADGDEVTFSVSGDELAITSAGVLSFVSAPDYETKIVYIASVTATDGVNSTTQDISVNVTNVNDISPVFTSELTFSAPENQISIGTVNAIDVEGDVISFSISGSELEITSAGFLTFVSAPDYETKTNYTAMVSASDGLNITTQEVYVNVTNLNDNSPEFLSNSIITAEENQSSAGIIKARDLDGDIINFSTMSNEFIITSSGELSFVELPNFETKSSYTVKIDITDGFNSNSKDFNIRIIDVEEDEPVYLSHTVEPSTLDVRTEDATLTYTIRVTDETGVDQSKLPKFETYFSPSYTDTVQEHELTLISGDKKDGIYSGTATIPAGSITGTWNLLQRRFTDENGIRQENGPLNTTFEVIGKDIEKDEPLYISHTVEPSTLDVRTEDATLTYTIRVTDETGVDQSKLPKFETYFSPSYTDTVQEHELTLISGDKKDGIYSGTATIPAGSITGTWNLLQRRFTDENGIRQENGPLNTTFEVIGKDIEKDEPLYISHTVEPSTLDVRTEDATLTYTIRVTDETGVDQSKLPKFETYFSPSYTDTVQEHELTLISGDKKDGIYSGTATIPAGSITGTWNLLQRRFTDENGIRQENGPLNTTFEVISEDQNAPTVTSFDFSPKEVDVREESKIVTLTAAVQDYFGITEAARYTIKNFTNNTFPEFRGDFELSSGTMQDGIWTAEVIIPTSTYSTDDYDVQMSPFKDAAGNGASIAPDGDRTLTVIGLEIDEEPPTVTSFDFSPKEVDVREESKIVTLTAAVQDNIGIIEAARYTIKNFTNNTFPEFRGDFELSSGTIQDGIWTAEVIIPTSTYSTDDYDVQMSPFKDAAGNGASIAPDGDRTLTVIGLEIDEEPPTVTSFDFSPKEVDVREESKIVTLTAAVQDNIGIIEAARYTIKNFTNNTFPEFRGDFELSSGTIQDGIWTAEVIIPTSTYSTDDYDVQMSPFKDAAGNGASIAPGTLGEFGDRTLTVLSNSKYNMNAPVFTSENSYSVEENILEIGTVTATDADGDELTFSTNSNSISIEPSSGLLKFINAPDFESQSSYTELITVSDGTYSTIMNLLISITDVDELSTANDCNYVINDASNNEFRYCWEESQSTSGTEYSANIVKPLTITFADESIEIPNISYAEKLYIDYGVILESTSLDWTNDQAYAIYQTLKKIPQNIRNEANDRRVFSKWTLTDLQIQDDISFDKSSKNIAVTIETSVFENANPRIASVDGKKGIYFSNKLHNALVRYITDGGKDASAVNKILLERYGVTTDIDDYSALTGEQATRFQAFQAEELVAIISMFEEMPSGYHKIDGLDYLVRRINGADNPYYPEAPAIAWDSSGYIEFMERAFNTVSIDYLHRLILHEKAHFLWAKIFDDELKNDWIELGGWYECSEKESGWCTTKQTEFVSAYAHLKNPNEDMAESLSYFIINPDALKSRSLAKYEFVRDRIMQGNIYISQIQENLTFTVYNLYPDYVFPGKVKKLLVSVDGEPIEDKTVTVEIQLHALDKILEGAAWARMRVFSTADTYFDLYLYPQNGQNLDTTLRGTYTLSKYAKSGFWKTSQLVLSDEVGNLRMEGANDFGWRMYVNNPNEDLDKPLYIADSMSLTKSLTTIENQEVDVITALWDIDEAFPRENQGCYGALNDENPLTYSLQKYSSQTYFGNYEAGKCLLEYVMPSYMPSGTYRLNYIRMIDEAGNESRNYFATPSGVDTGDNFSGDQLDELAKEVVLETSNPDITAPELDLNNLSISATPTNPDNPNGETIVKFTFRVKDDISGYKLGYYTFRDPQGLTSGFYHYPERRSEIFPSAEDLDWYEYTSTVVLPAGSAPGTWGVVELTLRDRALNFKTYSFTEIISFQTE